MSAVRPTGILSAMPEELAAVLEELDDVAIDEVAGRRFHRGRLAGRPVVAVVARIGKVAAATTTTLLVERFGAREILFTGVAGGVAREVAVGDVVIADRLLHHDLDARPLFPRYEIPLLGKLVIEPDAGLTARAERAAREVVGAARVRRGLVVSGDRFFASHDAVDELRARLPEALCVEMEGAAVAQVCHELGVPFAVMRTISDGADDAAPADFVRFLTTVCGPVARALVRAVIAG